MQQTAFVNNCNFWRYLSVKLDQFYGLKKVLVFFLFLAFKLTRFDLIQTQ